MFKGLKNFFEYTFLVILALGIIFSLILQSLFFKIVVIFLFGMIAATAHEFNKVKLNYPFVILIIGFVLGYLIAVKTNYRFPLLVFFILGIIAGSYSKKYLKKHLGYWK